MGLEQVLARNVADRQKRIVRVFNNIAVQDEAISNLMANRKIALPMSGECRWGGTDKDIIEKHPDCVSGARHKRKCAKWRVVTREPVGSAYMNCVRCKREGLGFELRLPEGTPDWKKVEGWLSDEEAGEYEKVLKSLQVQGDVVEFGTFCGKSAVFAAGVLYGTKRVLHCVDPWEGKRFEKGEAETRKNVAPFKELVRLYKGYSTQIVEKIKSKIACVYIDGNHTYESVKEDIETALKIVAPGGHLCGHDYDPKGFPGVFKAVNERFDHVHVKSTLWWVQIPEHSTPLDFTPSLTRSETTKLYKMLETVDKALGKIAGLRFALCFGAALGHARFGALLPWDEEGDYVVLGELTVEQLQSLLPQHGVVKTNCIKVFDPNSPKIPGKNYSFPFIDIVPAREEGEHIYVQAAGNKPDHKFDKSVVFPAKKQKLGPIVVTLPLDTKAFAKANYGLNCLDSAVKLKWSHRYEVPITDIETSTRVPLSSLQGDYWIPPAYVVNLDRRPERLQEVTIQMEKAGIKWERFAGIDGKELAPKNYPGGVGAYGCLESHRRILELAMARKQTRIMVFEDDVIIGSDFKGRLRDILSVLPPKWDALFIGGQIQGKTEQVWPGLLKPIDSGGACRTHGYILNGEYIRKLYNLWSIKKGHCDQIWAKVQYLSNVFYAKHWLVGQAGGESDISFGVHKERWW